MSELGQHGAYLKDRAEQAVVHTTRLYSSALDAAYPDLKLSFESQAKKEVEMLLHVAVKIAEKNGISYRSLVSEFVAVATEMYQPKDEVPF